MARCVVTVHSAKVTPELVQQLAAACNRYRQRIQAGAGDIEWELPEGDDLELDWEEDRTTEKIVQDKPDERLRTPGCICGFVPRDDCPVDHMGRRT